MRNRIHVVLDGSDAVGRRRIGQLTVASDWSLATLPTAPLPVLVYEMKDDEGLLDAMPRLRAELEEQGLRPLGMAGETLHDGSPVSVQMLMGDSGYAPMLRSINSLFSPAQPPAELETGSAPVGPPPPPEGGNGAAPRAATGAQTIASNRAGSGGAPAADGSCCSAAALTATAGLLADPRPLWEAVGDDGAALARGLIPRVYGDRSASVRQSGWVTGPELVLLDAIGEDERRAELADEMLRVRAHLTVEDRRLRVARALLREQEAELSRQRVALADEGVRLASEVRLQMTKWRRLADVGVKLLIFTTIVAAVATGYVLLQVESIDDLVAPVLIFALALFAVSPAVLLLNQRPLKGIDSWMPGGDGGRDDDAASTSDTGDKRGDATGDAARAR